MNQPSRTSRARRKKSKGFTDQKKFNPVNRLIESDLIRHVNFDTYRDEVRKVYGGPQGALLATASLLSLHSPLSERWLKKGLFDVTQAKSILDVGSGAGQIALHLMKYANTEAKITCCDLSHPMLRRARNRLYAKARSLKRAGSRRDTYQQLPHVEHVVADISVLPFADESFDCITCGYVLEHLPDARLGLKELSRVMQPGGRLLLLTTEDNFGGAWTSRFWRCRTYNRDELHKVSLDLGLSWNKELWFSPLHKRVKAGGICVEIVKGT